MSTSKKSRLNYSEEFKQHAVNLARNSEISIAQTARDLGIKENTLYNWLGKETKRARIMQNPKNTNKKTLSQTDKGLLAENKRLQKELKQAKIDLEILKKATAYCASLPE